MSGMTSHFHSPIHVHDWYVSVDGSLMCRCGAHRPAEDRLTMQPRRPSTYGDRQPIVIRSTRPRGADEMREMWEILAAFPWPVLALDHDWEVHGG